MGKPRTIEYSSNDESMDDEISEDEIMDDEEGFSDVQVHSDSEIEDNLESDSESSESERYERKRKVPYAKRMQAAKEEKVQRSTRLRGRSQINYNEESYDDYLYNADSSSKIVKKYVDSSESDNEESIDSIEEYDEDNEDIEIEENEENEEEIETIEEEEEEIEESEEHENLIVDKILAHRITPDGNEYYVKWKDRSYLHVAWVNSEEFTKDRFLKSKLLRYHKKSEILFDDVDDVFNASYVEIDRIIAHSGIGKNKKYLTKWEQLSYAESTWEDIKDIGDDKKIQEYNKRNIKPKREIWRDKKRPDPSKWEKYEKSPKYKDDHELRSYQLEGLNWLTFCWYNKRNSILADEMGLGKTVQTVSVINHLYSELNIHGPFLIIAPLITIPHWKREFEGWTDMNTIVYHGNSDSRALIREYEWGYKDSNYNKRRKQKFKVPPYKFNVLITTFEMVLTDTNILGNIKWKYIAIDEAHRLKNKNCKLIQVIRTFYFEHLLLLTGTPLQNNTEELWTLLNLMDPISFESLDDFSEKFGELKETKQVEELHKILRPYLLRRMKEDVEKSIAPKEETIVEVELTTIQKKYYRAIFERNFSSLNMGSKASNQPSLLNIMMQLRKCCNHPYLLRGVEENIVQSQKTQDMNDNILMIKSSGKLVLIDKLLAKLKAQGHKVLIFSQMVRMLDILEDFLLYRGYKYERIDGSKRGNDRQDSIDRFSAPNSDRFVFLLCTRAGGLGINLTAADTCIIYDSDWNPQNDIQAQARCHRIGQKKMVKIYRLITHNTYEKRMFEKASLKLGLDQAVLTKMKSKSGSSTTSSKNANAPLNTKEVDELLKYGAYGAFDDKPGTDHYDEEDIDKILERSSTVIVGGKSESNESINNALSSFSKASFISADAKSNANIDVTDPDFWKKLMPDAPITQPLVQITSRRRKQVKRYGNVDTFELATLEAKSESDSEMEEYEETHEDMGDDGSTMGWTIRDRNRIKTHLQTYGFCQWYTVRKAAGLDKYTIDEVIAYAESLAKTFIKFLGENVEEGLQYIYEWAIPERYGPNAQPYIIKNKKEITIQQTSELVHVDNKNTDTVNLDNNKENNNSLHSNDTTSDSNIIIPEQPKLISTENIENIDKSETETNSTVDKKDKDNTSSDAIKDNNDTQINLEIDSNDTINNNDNSNNVNDENDTNTINDTENKSNIESNDTIHTTDNESESNNMTDDKETSKNDENDSSNDKETQLKEFNFDDDLTLHGHEFKEYAKRNAKLLVRRLESIAKVSKKTIECIELYGEDIPIPNIPGDVCPSWTPEDDKSLILGTFYHGYNRFAEMRLDPKLSFTRFEDKDDVPVNIQNDPRLNKKRTNTTTTESTDETNKETSEEKEQWPSEKVLNRRLRKALRLILMDKSSTIEKKTRRPDVIQDWSKREKLDFYRIITTHGIRTNEDGNPNWDIIKEEAKLTRKSIQLISTYCASLMNQSNRAMALGKEYDTFRKTYLDSITVQTDDTNKKEPIPLNENIDYSWLENGDTSLSLAQCKRILQRVRLFKELRDIMKSDSTLSNELLHARLSTTLPNWWKPSIHDYALIKGVVAHGFSQWEKICKDKTLPFYSIAVDKLKLTEPKSPDKIDDSKSIDNEDEDIDGDDSLKRKKRGRQIEVYTNAINFPKEKMLTKRLEYLIKYLSPVERQRRRSSVSIRSLLSNPIPPTQNSVNTNIFNISSKKKQVKIKPKVKTKYTDVPRTSSGEVIFPIKIGKMEILSIGSVISDKKDFHTTKYIWPVGFKSKRTYHSIINANERTEYISEIIDGGDKPIFRVTANDNPDVSYDGTSATSAWGNIFKNLKQNEDKQDKKSTVSGPEFFGLSKGIIKKLIQELPGAENCKNYAMQDFEETQVVKRPKKVRKLALSQNIPNADNESSSVSNPIVLPKMEHENLKLAANKETLENNTNDNGKQNEIQINDNKDQIPDKDDKKQTEEENTTLGKKSENEVSFSVTSATGSRVSILN